MRVRSPLQALLKNAVVKVSRKVLGNFSEESSFSVAVFYKSWWLVDSCFHRKYQPVFLENFKIHTCA